MSRPADGPHPPRLAGWLLDRLDGRQGDGTVRGDLDEEFARHMVPALGARAAARWYWVQTVTSVPRLLLRRAGRRHGSPDGWIRRRFIDLRYAVRSVARRPGVTAAVTLTFGLALGVNASVFSLVHGVLVRPLPFEEPGRLVRIHPDELFYIQLSTAQRFAGETTTLDYVVPWARTLFTFTGEGEAEEARGALVQWDHFEMLGVRAALGRTFRREDAEASPTDAVVLSHRLWVRRFGADAGVVGRRVEVGGRPRTVIGVLPGDHVPMETDWEAWGTLPLDAGSMAGSGMAMNARLRTGVSLDQATADVRRAFAALWTARGSSFTEEDLTGIRVIPLRDHLLGDVTRPLWVLMGAVVLVLLLASVNVANLLLAQGDGRAAEMAVRRSLGASRGRLATQLLAETFLMSVLGGVLGLGLAWVVVAWATPRLPADVPRIASLDMGGAVVGYAVAAMLLAALLAAALPAARTSDARLTGAMGGGARGGTPRRERTASALVGVEVALSVVLVTGAGLMLRSMSALQAVDPGFRAEGIAVVRVTPPGGRYDADGALDALYDQVLQEAAARPGVASVGAIMFLPMTPGGAWARFRTSPHVGPDWENAPSASFRVVTPGYFETVGMPVLQGRAFTEADGPRAPAVALINESMVRRHFPGEDPVGRFLYQGEDASGSVIVVGVVGDVHQTSLRESSFPEVYFPLAQRPFPRMYVLARTDGDPGAALAGLRAAAWAVDDRLVLSRGSTLARIVDATVTDTRLLAQLLTLFGLVSLALGAVGVYGVTAHAVARRRREIGIRMALGAEGSAVAAATVARGMIPVALGLAAGVALAAAGSTVLADLVFGVGAADPLTILGVAALLAGVGLTALAVPALRASGVDPVQTLRQDQA